MRLQADRDRRERTEKALVLFAGSLKRACAQVSKSAIAYKGIAPTLRKVGPEP
jgi:hypothetical protein